MQVSRRNFFGIFGTAAVAGPKFVEESMENALRAPVGGYAIDELASAIDGVSAVRDLTGVKSALKALVGKTAGTKRREKARMSVYQYEPNVAALRSVSAVNKVRISKDRLYEIGQRREKMYLEGIIDGLWN